MKQLCIILPFYNELEVLPETVTRLKAVLNETPYTYTLLFVDDGSLDEGASYIKHMTSEDDTIQLLQLSRNFGKESAVTAGLDHAHAEATIVMDVDLQDPPELIGQMMDTFYREQVDVVIMQRISREGETWWKRYSARLFYRLLYCLSPLKMPIDSGDFRLLSHNAVLAIRQLPERNRYMKGLMTWIGLKTTSLPYHRKQRVAGTTKWSQLQLIGLAFDAITSFTALPLRLSSILGLVCSLGSFVFGVVVVVRTLMFGKTLDEMNEMALLVSVVTWIGGLQLMAIGLLGEYIGKIYIESKARPVYMLRDPGLHKVSQKTCEKVASA